MAIFVGNKREVALLKRYYYRIYVHIGLTAIEMYLKSMSLNFALPGSHSVEARNPAAAAVGYAVLDCLVETSGNTMIHPPNTVAQALTQINDRWCMGKFEGCR